MSGSALEVRKGVGLFELPERALLRVRGGDRIRWTNGMITNDVARLEEGGERAGCHALLLTPKGRIVSDLHVLARESELWLELPAAALEDVQGRLERFIIADDVALEAIHDDWRRFGLEGPLAFDTLSTLAGVDFAPAPEAVTQLCVAGHDVLVAAWGWSGERAVQLFVPREAAQAVGVALRESLAAQGGVEADAQTLEVLRIEAGTPRYGAELGQDALPAEVGLVGRAVSLEKGCYTGQEIVARMDSRNAAAHRLLGLRLETPEAAEVLGAGADAASARGTLLRAGKKVGEISSACVSPHVGPIALAFVRTAHAEPGGEFEVRDASGAERGVARSVVLPHLRAASPPRVS